jgi:hypothetical protein
VCRPCGGALGWICVQASYFVIRKSYFISTDGTSPIAFADLPHFLLRIAQCLISC